MAEVMQAQWLPLCELKLLVECRGLYERKRVYSEGFVKNAVVTPSVDFHRLEEVFVLTSSSLSAPQKPELEPKLVPQTQRDQVEGAKGAVKQ